MTDPNRSDDPRPPGAAPARKRPAWLPWVLGAVALLLLLLILRSCGDRDDENFSASTLDAPGAAVTTPGAAPPASAGATAPGAAAPAGTAFAGPIESRLQQYLASAQPAGGRFTFDTLHFATGSAELPADAGATVQAVARTMTQYPNARVRVEGYADARGSEGANAQLGARRAEAVARALIGAGVPAGSVTSASGSESNPVDTNATPQGQAQNRRTDLVVVAK